MSRNVQEELSQLVKSHPVVLFMKGSKSFPQCGFSATVVQILGGLGAEFKDINVLADPEIRQGIKEFSQWPTIPQLYVGGEFVGGCDIVREMYQSGDLQNVLGISTEGVEPPAITVTDAAAQVLQNALSEADPGDVVHLSIDSKFRADLHVAPRGASDVAIEGLSVALVVDLASVQRANGVRIDFVEQRGQAGFKIDNPNAPAEVVELSASEIKEKLASGEIKHLFDVRSPEEREIAKIDGAVHLDDDAVKMIEGLDKDTPLAFHCHHGRRSMTAAEHFRDQGFRKLYNMAGGIEAWSQLVDSNIPRY